MQKKPFSTILHMSPRERMVTLVWTSCVLSGLLLVSVLFFVRPFPMFSQDSVAVLDATVADMNTQDKGRFVRIQVVPNPSDAGAWHPLLRWPEGPGRGGLWQAFPRAERSCLGSEKHAW